MPLLSSHTHALLLQLRARAGKGHWRRKGDALLSRRCRRAFAASLQTLQRRLTIASQPSGRRAPVFLLPCLALPTARPPPSTYHPTPSIPAPRRALGDPDFKTPRRLVEAQPDVTRLELRPGADAFLLLGRRAGTCP